MEVPRLGVQMELQLLACTTAMQDPSCICDLHHSSWQCQIFNPLSEARDLTRDLMVPSQICFHCATTGIPVFVFGCTCGSGSFQARDWNCATAATGATAAATAMPDLSRICDLHHSSWQCQIFNPLSEARDWTLSHDGNSAFHVLDCVFWCKKVFNFDKY